PGTSPPRRGGPRPSRRPVSRPHGGPWRPNCTRTAGAARPDLAADANLRAAPAVLFRRCTDPGGLRLPGHGARRGGGREPEPGTLRRARAGDLAAFEALGRDPQAGPLR